MLKADDSHVFNLRISNTVTLAQGRRVEVSGDVFNLFNSDAAFDFISKDDRSSNFGRRTSYVPARVGQVGIRIVF